MSIRAIDSAGDWLFGRGRTDLLTNNDAVALDIKTRLREFFGNCFFNTTAGIDWFTLLGGKDKTAIEIAIKTVILNTQYVTGILELFATLDENRKLRLGYTVSTSFPGVVRSVSGYLLTEFGDVLTTEDGDPIHA